MRSKRGNPAVGSGNGNRAVTFNQHVVNPQADVSGPETSVDKGNPAKMKVPAGKRTVISQSVLNPVSSTKDGPGKVKK